jgi:hypothetical protein
MHVALFMEYATEIQFHNSDSSYYPCKMVSGTELILMYCTHTQNNECRK